MTPWQAFASLPFAQQAGIVAVLTVAGLAILVTGWALYVNAKDQPENLWPDWHEERLPPSLSQYVARQEARLSGHASKGFDRKLRAVPSSQSTTLPTSSAV